MRDALSIVTEDGERIGLLSNTLGNLSTLPVDDVANAIAAAAGVTCHRPRHRVGERLGFIRPGVVIVDRTADRRGKEQAKRATGQYSPCRFAPLCCSDVRIAGVLVTKCV